MQVKNVTLFESKNNKNENSCKNCGFLNVQDAHYCGKCGFFLGEMVAVDDKFATQKDSAPERPIESAERHEEFIVKIPRCPRCGDNIDGLDRCKVCGLMAPSTDDTPDEFFTDFVTGFPQLLQNPEEFIDHQKYRLGWTAMVNPVLWLTLSFVVFWVVVFFSRGTSKIQFGNSLIPFTSFIFMSMAVIVFILPWLIVLYVMLFHATHRILGGRGKIERTCKAICVSGFGMFLLLGTLLALTNVANGLITANNDYLIDSPWRTHYLVIPIVLKGLLIITQLFFLSIQVRLLARVNYMDIGKSILAHIISATPLVIYFALNYYGFA